MNIPTIITNFDAEERMHAITINYGRNAITIRCYEDDTDTAIVDICEKVSGYIDRRLAFIADGMETKVYGLDPMGRPTPEGIQRAQDRADVCGEER